MNNCSGGAAVLSKTFKQTTFCIKTINITGESEHKNQVGFSEQELSALEFVHYSFSSL